MAAYTTSAAASTQKSRLYEIEISATPISGAAVVPRLSASRCIAKIITCRCFGVRADSMAALAGR